MVSMDNCAALLAYARKTIGRSRPRFCSFKCAITRRSIGHQRIQQLARCLSHSVHGPDEGGLVDFGRSGKPTEFSNKLESGCPYLGVRRGWLEVVKGFNVSAHAEPSFGASQIANRTSVQTSRDSTTPSIFRDSPESQ